MQFFWRRRDIAESLQKNVYIVALRTVEHVVLVAPGNPALEPDDFNAACSLQLGLLFAGG